MPATKKRVPAPWNPGKPRSAATAEPVRKGEPSKPRETLPNKQHLNVLLRIHGDLLTRLDDNLTKLLHFHFYTPKPRIPEEQFREARRLASTTGEKAANAYLKQCRAQLDNPTKYKPSRHSFIYKLISLGLDVYEKDSDALNKLIIFGEKPDASN